MAGTNNAVNNELSGATGSGNFVGNTSPTLITPVLGVAHASSIQFTTTNGIIGTNTNDTASAGSVGELISSVIPVGSAVSLTTMTPANITTISLTAGDWDIFGNINFIINTSAISLVAWSNTVSATSPDGSLFNSINVSGLNGSVGISIPSIPIFLATTTTIYLSAQAAFTGTLTACGGIYARRRR